jgi:hypothetical protein
VVSYLVLISTTCTPLPNNSESLIKGTISALGTETSQLATRLSGQQQIDDAQQDAISDLSTRMPFDFDEATETLTPLPFKETLTPYPVCTPPSCAPDEMYHCPDDCPGGCGTTCATATPGISSGTGQAWGEICYPEETIPEMTIYFQETNTQGTLEFTVAVGQDSYQLDIPAGVYVAFAWLPNNVAGGGYTQFVRCNPNISSCTDHALVPFLVQDNHVVVDVDICDWDTDKIEFPILPEE